MNNLLIGLFLGVMTGTITGLIPGLHFNNIVALILAYPFLLPLHEIRALLVFIVAMATTHTFLDTIPSTFLGAPDTGTVLGVLPAHRFLLKGRGPEAVRLTIIGSIGALILGVGLFPLWVIIGNYLYKTLSPFIGELLLIVVFLTFLGVKKKSDALLIIIGSSLIGELAMNITNGLIPMLSGMFGASTIIYSLASNEARIPRQEQSIPVVNIKQKWLAVITSQFSGFLTALLPGLGAGYAAAIGSMFINGEKLFLILQGGVTTSNFVMSLATLKAFGKARNGAILGTIALGGNTVLGLIDLLLYSCLAAGGIAVMIALIAIRTAPLVIQRVPYWLLNIIILCWIILLNLLLVKHGIALFIISTGLGLIANILGVRKSLMMSSIMIPIGIRLL
ncbi:tripartite tricarboxylate transporter permease [Candidatus Woesearchaeota archaeon]|nr:tripartite tricarboxylate transporter permease [Candidatus Woesearchaeota archaeon]